MPKRGRDFPDQLSFGVTTETRLILIALGYLMGVGGEYAPPARNFLEKAIQERLGAMGEKERANFDQILENVRVARSKKDEQ